MNYNKVIEIQYEMVELFKKLSLIEKEIKDKLSIFSDGKLLKGNELVGWLGEIYGKSLLNGKLVNDIEEHDFITSDNMRISVKTRKGVKPGWQRSSAIPKIDGDGCPTHLMFVHLHDNYLIDRIWLFNWSDLYESKRFTIHYVKGIQRSYIFNLNEKKDINSLIFPEKEMVYGLSNSNVIVKQNDFSKLNRIALWARRPNQYNHKIIKAFLKLEKNGIVKLSELIFLCSNESSGYYVKDFNGHYNSMKTDYGHSHGKVFYDENGVVYIYPIVMEKIRKYFDSENHIGRDK